VPVLSLAFAGGADAAAKRTKDFAFTSKGTAIQSGAVVGTGTPGSYEDFPFTIAKGDQDGDISVHIDWVNPGDDWDLYVFRRGPGNSLETVASSTSGAPNTEENAVRNSQGVPITPGKYVIRVQNYAAVTPGFMFKGTARFGQFVPYDKRPVAKLSAPKSVKKGTKVKLDASKSYDPDGKITSYAFDLDGNGTMEVKNGTNPVLKRVLSPGTHHVAVRVIDNKGLRAFATRTVVVQG
jgi:PKD domain